MDCEYCGYIAKFILIVEDGSRNLFQTDEIKNMNYVKLIQPSKYSLNLLTSTNPSLTTQGLNDLMLLNFYTRSSYYTINHVMLYSFYVQVFKKLYIFVIFK